MLPSVFGDGCVSDALTPRDAIRDVRACDCTDATLLQSHQSHQCPHLPAPLHIISTPSSHPPSPQPWLHPHHRPLYACYQQLVQENAHTRELEQSEQIEGNKSNVVDSVSVVERGVEQLRKAANRGASFRMMVMFMILLLSF